jgi:N-acyl homoserine lactone hydrolase
MTKNTTIIKCLYLLQSGTATMHLPNGQTFALCFGSYLVQTNDGKNMLIDSGFPADLPRRPDSPPVNLSKNVLEHLAVLGLQPEDIHYVIATHFDVDHSGYHDSFPQAEFIVQRDHYELARSGYRRFAPARAHWDHPALNYQLIDGDTELFPGLTLLATPGHCPGHQSVLLQLPETGPVLLAIDAVAYQRAFTSERQKSPLDDNEEQLRASTVKLLELVDREHVALTVHHHDGEQWATLKLAPDYYA